DLMMPNVDGIQVLRYLGSQNCASDIVLISGYDKKVLMVAGQLAKALGLHVRAAVQKPIKLNQLREILAKRGDAKRQSPAGRASGEDFADQESMRRAIADDQLLV